MVIVLSLAIGRRWVVSIVGLRGGGGRIGGRPPRLIGNKNDVMRLGERPRSLEGKPNITGTDRERQTGRDRQGLTERD